ncbi:hypothetical protein [Methylophilus sp. QUAN]|uniref:hypothetical protein n=1 Tax=Methylophilus sp. QUAN TaxID=2781020 RepID=UPI00188E13A9|nr:hypothetical protein [Methylophilus sp. QUAN]MBF4991122.1 hypothetical protein [Methylophilus sp. QUAN]
MQHFVIESTGNDFNFITPEGLIVNESYPGQKERVRWRLIIEVLTNVMYVEPILDETDTLASFLERAWAKKDYCLFQGRPNTLYLAKSVSSISEMEIEKLVSKGPIEILAAPKSMANMSGHVTAWSRQLLYFSFEFKEGMHKDMFRQFVQDLLSLLIFKRWDVQKPKSQRKFNIDHDIFYALDILEVHRHSRPMNNMDVHRFLEINDLQIDENAMHDFIIKLYEIQEGQPFLIGNLRKSEVERPIFIHV